MPVGVVVAVPVWALVAVVGGSAWAPVAVAAEPVAEVHSLVWVSGVVPWEAVVVEVVAAASEPVEAGRAWVVRSRVEV